MLKAGNEKLQEITAKKLDTIGTKQRDLRKRLHDHDMKDVPPAKKIKLELFLLMMKTMNNAIDIFLISFSVSLVIFFWTAILICFNE